MEENPKSVLEEGREQVMQEKDRLIEFLLEKATTPNEPDAADYQLLYEALSTGEKLSWDHTPHGLVGDFNERLRKEGAAHFLSREFLYDCFWDNGNFDPLFRFREQKHNVQLLEYFKVSRQEPTREFINEFRREFAAYLEMSYEPTYFTSESGFGEIKEARDSLLAGEPVHLNAGSQVRDSFAHITQTYRLPLEFIDTLREKLTQ